MPRTRTEDRSTLGCLIIYSQEQGTLCENCQLLVSFYQEIGNRKSEIYFASAKRIKLKFHHCSIAIFGSRQLHGYLARTLIVAGTSILATQITAMRHSVAIGQTTDLNGLLTTAVSQKRSRISCCLSPRGRPLPIRNNRIAKYRSSQFAKHMHVCYPSEQRHQLSRVVAGIQFVYRYDKCESLRRCPTSVSQPSPQCHRCRCRCCCC